MQGHEIILSLDANETHRQSNSGLRRLSTTCSLLDIHKALHPHTALPSHRRGRKKIDYMFASPRILQCVSKAGILAMDRAYGSDHRLLFVDLDIQKCFNGVTADPVTIPTRSFTTKNTKRTNIFVKQSLLNGTKDNCPHA